MIFIQSNKRWWVILLKLLALLISILQVQIHKTIFQKQEFLKFGFLSKICVWHSFEHFSRNLWTNDIVCVCAKYLRSLARLTLYTNCVVCICSRSLLSLIGLTTYTNRVVCICSQSLLSLVGLTLWRCCTQRRQRRTTSTRHSSLSCRYTWWNPQVTGHQPGAMTDWLVDF